MIFLLTNAVIPSVISSKSSHQSFHNSHRISHSATVVASVIPPQSSHQSISQQSSHQSISQQSSHQSISQQASHCSGHQYHLYTTRESHPMLLFRIITDKIARKVSQLKNAPEKIIFKVVFLLTYTVNGLENI